MEEIIPAGSPQTSNQHNAFNGIKLLALRWEPGPGWRDKRVLTATSPLFLY